MVSGREKAGCARGPDERDGKRRRHEVLKRPHFRKRTCLGCGQRDEKRRLMRMVLRGGNLRIAATAPGRGGYLHGREECWRGFVKRKSLYRAFRCESSRESQEELIEELRRQMG